MWVDQAQIERSQEWVTIRDGDEYGSVYSLLALIHFKVGLDGVASNPIPSTVGSTIRSAGAIGTIEPIDNAQRCVCYVELRHPGDVSCATSVGLRCGGIAVIRTNVLSWKIPLQQDLPTRGCERCWANVTD